MNSLPDIYDHLITTLLYGKDEIKFDDVSNALTNNEYHKKDKQAHRDTVSEALIVGYKSNRNFGKDECAYCHKKGHWKKNCPLLKNMDNEDSNVSVAQSSDEDSDFTLTCSSFVCIQMSGLWIQLLHVISIPVGNCFITLKGSKVVQSTWVMIKPVRFWGKVKSS